MPHALITLALLTSTLAHAGGYHRVVETETLEAPFNDLSRVTCEPGENRAHHFPTTSMLIINVKDLIGEKFSYPNLVIDDERAGDHCREMMLDLAAKLPGILAVARTKTESCVEESIGPNRIRAHYLDWQETHGGALGIQMRGAYDTIQDRYEVDQPCRQ